MKVMNAQINKMLDEFPSFKGPKVNPKTNKCGRAFGLVKVHKKNFPIRLIINTKDTSTHRLGSYINKLLKKDANVSEFLRFCVENSYLAKNAISRVKLDPTDKLYSLDVESMYTNIPVDNVIKFLEEYLVIFNDHTGNKKSFIIRAIGICLSVTIFKFNGKFYAQKNGLAMGNPLSPVIANIFMCQIDKLQNFDIRPKIMLRYLDDYFVISKLTIRQMSLSINKINNSFPTIKLTTEKEQDNSLSFLDLKLIKSEGKIKTRIFRKTTCKNFLLNFNSYCFWVEIIY